MIFEAKNMLKSIANVALGAKRVHFWMPEAFYTAKGTPSDPKVRARMPKVAPRVTKGGALEAKIVPKGPPGKHFGGNI